MKRPVGTGTLRALLVLSTACGLMLVSAADALSRSGHAHGSVLFWLGLIAILAPVTARLISASPSRNERVGLLVMLGLASYLVKVFRDPFRFLYADEFVHQYNALSILSTHGLFHQNPILPATAAYPGLESPTAALSALTGLSTFASGLVVIAIARVIMMIALFLLYETVTGSAPSSRSRRSALRGQPALPVLHRGLLVRITGVADRDPGARRRLASPSSLWRRQSAVVDRGALADRGRRGYAPHDVVRADHHTPGDLPSCRSRGCLIGRRDRGPLRSRRSS